MLLAIMLFVKKFIRFNENECGLIIPSYYSWYLKVVCNFDPVLLPITKRYFNISVTFAKVYPCTCEKLQPVTLTIRCQLKRFRLMWDANSQLSSHM